MIAHSSSVEHAALILLGICAVGLYGWGWVRSPRLAGWRLGAWCGGVATLLASVLPFIERWAQRSFTGHMVQHLGMIVVAAPLIVLAKPMRTVRCLPIGPDRPSRKERSLARRWRSHGSVISAALFITVLYMTHLTAIYDAALGNRYVHDIEHLAYVASAVSLWAALRSASHRAAPANIGAVFGVIGASALLGVVLLSASSPLVPTYADRLGTEAALDDQRIAASLMWVGGMATTLPLLIISVWRWAATEDRIAQRSETLIAASSDSRASANRRPPRSRSDFEATRRATPPRIKRPVFRR